MLEALSMLSDEIMGLLLEEAEVPIDLIHKTIRDGDDRAAGLPVMIGSAYRNKGVQLAAGRHQPVSAQPARPRDLCQGPLPTAEPKSRWLPDPDAPLVAMAFKLVEEPFGQVTFIRIYQGTLAKGNFYYNTRQRKRTRISRILRMHADQKEDIDSASAGDIVAVMGVECAPGDTYCSEGTDLSLESIYAAEPVIDLSIQPLKRADYDKLSKALHRFMREDPTFRVHVDQETSETIISGMGELHLEIYVERIRREYKVRLHRRRAQGELPRGADQAKRRSTTSTRNRPAAPASMPTSSGKLDAARSAGRPSRSCSRTRSPAAGFPGNTSRRSRRASANRCTRGRSPATR